MRMQADIKSGLCGDSGGPSVAQRDKHSRQWRELHFYLVGATDELRAIYALHRMINSDSPINCAVREIDGRRGVCCFASGGHRASDIRRP